MNKNLYELVELAFSRTALEEELVSKIADSIDYEVVAELLFDSIETDIHDAAAEVARDLLL